MDTLLNTKIDTIAVGTQMLKRELFLMEQCPGSQDTTLHENAIELLIKRVMRLQFDVTALMAKYMFADFRRPVGRTSRLLDELWGVFLTLDRMYGTLTMLEKQADGFALHPAELKQLQIFWVRLNRLTKQVKEHLEEGKLLTAGKRWSVVH